MDIDWALKEVETVVRPFPKAAMFELAEAGFNTPFQQLVGCILSIRTRDEVSLPTALRLFAEADSAKAIAALSIDELAALIYSVSFFQNKAHSIHAIAVEVDSNFGGELPCDREVILSFKGVGPKCANLAMGIACGEPLISVDIHVHRITNRWGYIETATPEKTMTALEQKLPKPYWIDINRLLVAFGKHICVGNRPFCSTCPLVSQCPQIGVKNPR